MSSRRAEGVCPPARELADRYNRVNRHRPDQPGHYLYACFTSTTTLTNYVCHP